MRVRSHIVLGAVGVLFLLGAAIAATDQITGGRAIARSGSFCAGLGTAIGCATGAISNRQIEAKLRDTVSLKDFGATGDGSTDDSTAIQAAFTAIAVGGSATGKNLLIPVGTYLYSTPIVAKNLRTVSISADGNRNTILRYTGAVGGTAFKCLNCYRATFRGIRFDRLTNDPVNIVAIIEDSTQSDYDSSAPSQLNTFEDCTFKNGATGLLIDFVTNDVMNDNHRFVRNVFDGQTGTAISISGQNALGLVFDGNYSTSAPHALQVQANAGSFKWYNGYVNSTVSNFDFLSISSDGYTIIGARSESSPRFLSYAGASATPATFLLAGIAYSAASLNGDSDAISSTGGGPYVIIGGTWGGAGNADPTPPRFKIQNNSTNVIGVTVIGNSFGADSADTVQPLRASSGNRLFAYGNRYKVGVTSVWTAKVEESFATAERESTITYTSGVAMALDASIASIFKVVVNDGVAIVLNAPTNATAWQTVKVQIKATAALNAANPFGGAGWRSGAWVNPGNGNGYVYQFMYDGTSWFQIGTPVIVAN